MPLLVVQSLLTSINWTRPQQTHTVMNHCCVIKSTTGLISKRLKETYNVIILSFLCFCQALLRQTLARPSVYFPIYPSVWCTNFA